MREGWCTIIRMHPLRGKIETERCGRERKGKKKKEEAKERFQSKIFSTNRTFIV